MDLSLRRTFSGLAALFALFLLLPQLSLAKSVAYCSTENTSDFEKQHWPWQSQGWCNDACKSDHPYGIVQGEYCWCSDYAPADTVSTSDCSASCPGYPDEKCGNTQENLFIYIRLDSTAKVKGTKGGSQPTSSSVSPSSSARSISFASSTKAPSSSENLTPSMAPPSPIPTSRAFLPDPETVVQTVTVSASVVTLIPTLISTHSSSASIPGTTAIPNDSVPPPMTSMQVITVSGVVVTKTIITGPTNVAPVTHPKKTSTSAIVGGVVGGVAVLCAVAGAVLFTLWRRRRQQYQEDGQSGVQRNASTMSKMPFGSGSGPQYPPTIATNFNGRNSRILDSDSISPISVSDRRSSRLVFDQRLNPSAIMVLDNPSRESFASMDDSRDYGRTLNVRNPDPHP